MGNKERVRYYFACKGNVAFIELERFLALNPIGKTVLPMRIKNDLQAIGWPVDRVIFARLSDVGAERDEMFSSEVAIPQSWLRYRVING